jgi:hypothetical protein
MKPGGGKQKGAQFERDTCVKLSLWVTAGEKRDCFWRSAMSGGRATVFKAKGIDLSRQAGDITAVAPEGHALTNLFFIEAKFYRCLELDRFLFGGGQLAAFWKTAVTEARSHGRKPMVVAQENRRPALVLVQPGTLSKVSKATALARVNGKLGRPCDVYLFDTLLAAPFQATIAV